MNLASLFNRNSEEFDTKKILKLLPDAVFVLSEEGQITWANKKAVLMFENLGKPLSECHFDEIVADGMVIAENAIKESKSIATGAFSSTGKEIFIELSAVKNEDEYYVTARDITTLTGLLELAEDTGKLNKEKNYMLCKLSGDLKSPIQSIAGFTQTLLEGGGGKITQKQTKYLNIINKNANELSYFLDKLLEFSWAQSTLLKVVYKTFDIQNCIQNITKPMGIVFEHEDLEKRNLCSDESLIKTVIMSLFDAASKVSDSGEIGIKLKTDNQNAHISVYNKGVGLAEDEKPDLFDPYSQLDKPGRRNVLRSLNLATAENIVKKLAGEIVIESSLAYGTVFNVVLPMEKIDE